FTPETIRQREAEIKLMNKISLTGIFEESNGQLSGFSNLGYSLDLPEMVKQGLTSVREEYRGKGLGKRIKAIMIKELLKINKSVKFIDTDNANSNAPMLAINERMGFRKYKETYQFQIKLDELEKRITQKSGVVII
ncbi:MAG: GNAT family N-acetyltransferase, partial [Candidatus Heimdallarchaeota archaeon]|nr:GNAT family N-acetyltransferase [Candidatus Heimdallarchaeota archaeon]